jgi:hypothetical protein
MTLRGPHVRQAQRFAREPVEQLEEDRLDDLRRDAEAERETACDWIGCEMENAGGGLEICAECGAEQWADR